MPAETAQSLPTKLKHDAIVEAVFEIRFESEGESVPEMFFGKLADAEEWRGFKPRRLPSADIPAALRRADPELRYQPSIDLVHPDGAIIVRIGPQVLAYVRRAPYPGWSVFGEEIRRAIGTLFATLPGIEVSRLGLRYVNGFRKDLHNINGIADLNIDVRVASRLLQSSVNLNYKIPLERNTACVVRIATVDFVKGNLAEDTTVLADLDVACDRFDERLLADQVASWSHFAHEEEKRNFFELLSESSIQNLRVN